MLIENVITREGIRVRDKVKIAIERLQSFEPQEGYWLAFSGGKDSCVIKKLADMSKVKYEAHYNLTTVDPPELVYFIRGKYPNVIIDVPEESMWDLIVRNKMPPTRLMRYCCEELKERYGSGRVVITGVRWAESARRKKNRDLVDIVKGKKWEHYSQDNEEARRIVEQCVPRHKVTVNPIIDWDDDEVWEFIHKYKVPYCSLYDEGFTRIGCIGCPMAGKRKRLEEFERWPKYKEIYIRAFDRMLKAREDDGKKAYGWTNGQDVFDWWLEINKSKQRRSNSHE